MKTCLELRLENARALAVDGPAEFARKLDMTGQQANQLIGPNPKRGIGHDKAREIERTHGKEPGWLDHDHSATGEADSPVGWGELTEVERARVEGFISGLLAARISKLHSQKAAGREAAVLSSPGDRRGPCE